MRIFCSNQLRVRWSFDSCARDILADSIPIITVSHRGAARLRGGHLWVYRSDLVLPVEAPGGALVQVCDDRGRRLGIGTL